MRLKLTLLLSLSVLFSICLFAQKKKKGAMPQRITCTFGDVKAEDFTPTAYAVDSSADAVYLFNGANSSIVGSKSHGFDVVQIVHIKTRILKKAAFHLATVHIRLYVTSKFQQQLDGLKAVTYNLSNSLVTSTAVNKTDVFETKQDNKFVDVKFTFPNVTEGSIIEYSYQITTPGPNNLPGWEFQKPYPALWSEYEVTYPLIFNYIFSKRGYQPYVIDTVKFKSGSYLVNQERGIGIGHTEESVTVTSEVADCIWAMKDVRSLKEEPFTTTLENHVSRIDFQLSSIQYSENQKTNYLQSWAGVSDTLIHEDYYLGKAYVTANGFLSDDLKKTVSGTADELTKAKKIYEWVRDNFTSTETRPWLEQPLRKVYQSKKGNTAEINSILLIMLREAGLNAYPVLLSTTYNGKINKDYPLLDEYNCTICSVNISGNNYLLDASDNKLGFNRLSAECYNGYARVINPANPELLNLSADSLKENNITSVVIINDSDSKMLANVSNIKGYEESLSLRKALSKSGKTSFFKNIKQSYSDNTKVENETIDSLQLLDMPLKISYDLKIDTNGEDILYFNPMLAEQQKENPFAAAERYYPVEMPYCTDEVYVLNMEIPKGYEVDELPKSARVKLNENEGLFEYIIAKCSDRIQFRSRIKLEKAVYEPDDYQTLRDFFGFVVKKEAEQIVFKKIK